MDDSRTFEVRMDHASRNALDEALVSWLVARFDEADGRPVLLRGSTDAFCAGLNLKRVGALDGAAMEDFLRALDRMIVKLYEYPAPTMALIEGHAIAGGCVLAQTCDYRVASDGERIRMGVNEVALGACFPPSVLRLMRARVPRQHREQVLLGAQLYSTRQALELGLLDEVCSDPETRARERLAVLASHPAETYAATKSALRDGVLRPTAEDERRFTERELPLWCSDELRERIRAVLDRSKRG